MNTAATNFQITKQARGISPSVCEAISGDGNSAVEFSTDNRAVGGSNPPRPTMQFAESHIEF